LSFVRLSWCRNADKLEVRLQLKFAVRRPYHEFFKTPKTLRKLIISTADFTLFLGIIPVYVGANDIANILGDTIIDQEPPLTVGVFGKWNSGKTQLLNRTKGLFHDSQCTNPNYHFMQLETIL